MILINGIKYQLRTPKVEKELEDMVEEHAEEIFGEDYVYLNLKRKLTSKSGIVSIPDGYVIRLSKPYEWYIVEAELSTHPLHEHIVIQLSKFTSGIKSYDTQRELTKSIYDAIIADESLKAKVQNKIGHDEIHHFVSQVISGQPRIVVVIDNKGLTEEILQRFPEMVEPIEFRTYIAENDPSSHAHSFTPLHGEEIVGSEVPVSEPESTREGEVAYWLTPVRSEEGWTAEQDINQLVGRAHIYAFGEATPGRKSVKPGDWICFYASAKGVIAHAKVVSSPENKPNPWVINPDKYPWVFRLEDVRLYLDEPVVLDEGFRSKLDFFKGKDWRGNWGIFVQSTRTITRHDFGLLTRQE